MSSDLRADLLRARIYGGIDWSAPTIENVTRAFDPLYLTIFLDSGSSQERPPVALLIGYPAAYAIAKARRSGRRRTLFLAMLPSGPTT